ncbi:hypothetical protein ABGB07_28210 [Micromonosporaceae bacterium B7E4]
MASRVYAAALAVLLALTACTGGTPSSVADDPGQARYGAAPVRHPDVALQPDVVVVDGGSGSVRSVTDGGLTWRLDPRAGGADQLTPGKVMFVTGRGVGRVMDARPDGDDLAVTIGPVGITDVIRDGTFAAEQPIQLSTATAHEITDPFWANPDAAPTVGPTARNTGLTGVGSARPVLAADTSAPVADVALRAGGLIPHGVCCSDGVGVRFSYDGDGLRLTGAVTFVMRQPSAKFHLVISGASVQRAELEIHGAAGLRVQVDAATMTGSNVHPTVFVPVDWSVSMGQVLGIPLAATVRQAIGIRTGFSAGHSIIKAAGEFPLGGTIGFGYANGRFGPRWVGEQQGNDSLVDSVEGVSVGANAIIIDYDAKFYVGIGAAGFTAGLYAGLSVSIGITRGSSVGFGGLGGLANGEGCRRVDVTINGTYGIGYTIPALVAKVINVFLRIFNAKPIETSGGIPKPPPTVNLVNHHMTKPTNAVCKS